MNKSLTKSRLLLCKLDNALIDFSDDYVDAADKLSRTEEAVLVKADELRKLVAQQLDGDQV